MNISFKEPVYLIGGGGVSKSLFERVYMQSAPLIAVDAGALYLKKWGFVPEYMVGDMDSVDPGIFSHTKTKLIQIPDQNSTDLEKALDTFDAPLYICFGFTGKRFDHTLEILHVIEKYAARKIIFVTETDVIFLVPPLWTCDLPVRTRVSFYPLTQSTIQTSDGFLYSLDNTSLKQGNIIGTSNSTNKSHQMLHIEQGFLLGIVPVKFLNTIKKSLTHSI